jgi:hypothetical protein
MCNTWRFATSDPERMETEDIPLMVATIGIKRDLMSPDRYFKHEKHFHSIDLDPNFPLCVDTLDLSDFTTNPPWRLS